ncbi:hypothetical protein PNQ29_00600 [Halobacterium salinarum]|uniref:hypothetical protein n=1 Tax=Halobacterium salinarum TaxID=2242 RepID=UPI00255284EC|nr:hypothetical protein [Halobacterium salinarum]MDL0118259.1 hypothetical protein [Halobacterium salinarum]
MSLDEMNKVRTEAMAQQYKLFLEYQIELGQIEPSTPFEQDRKESLAKGAEHIAEDLPFVEDSLDLDGGDDAGDDA